MGTQERILEMVHHCYWDNNANCAQTTLHCLEQLTSTCTPIAVSGHCRLPRGSGPWRAMRLEGATLFLGLYCAAMGKSAEETEEICARYALVFNRNFGSMACSDLRPGGFRADDPLPICASALPCGL